MTLKPSSRIAAKRSRLRPVIVAFASLACKILAISRPMPALPYIIGPEMKHHAGAVLDALRQAIEDAGHPEIPVGVIPATADEYAPIADMADAVAGIRLT